MVDLVGKCTIFVAFFAYSPCISIAYLTARADGHVIARRTWDAACGHTKIEWAINKISSAYSMIYDLGVSERAA